MTRTNNITNEGEIFELLTVVVDNKSTEGDEENEESSDKMKFAPLPSLQREHIAGAQDNWDVLPAQSTNWNQRLTYSQLCKKKVQDAPKCSDFQNIMQDDMLVTYSQRKYLKIDRCKAIKFSDTIKKTCRSMFNKIHFLSGILRYHV